MDLAFLHPLYEHPGPWASVYVDTSRHTEDTPHERHLTAQALARDLADRGADEATCRAVRHALEELEHSSEPHGRALFARAGEVVLDPPLARPPLRDSADWAPLPHTAPLLELAGEDPVCVVAYVDRRGAHFVLRTALGRQDAGGVTGRQWPVHRTSTADWSERHFQLKVENTWEHNAAEIADALTVCQEETQADLLILVGEDRERRAVHERLPRRLHDLVVEAPHGGGSRLLDEDVESVRQAHVRQRAERELSRFLAARDPGEGGRAVEGVPALVEAAREHRIDELLIRLDSPDAHREVWIGEDPDQVAVRRTDLKTLGEQRSWAARADDALMRSAVATGAEAVAVGTAEAPVGGLGALLRWP
ncbi:Vms1/Ankzf1 family peptidyl-tRNA hydrolase [Streptomyces sp. P17]|uniref:baeRF2 domain-containing protein n=1 Tax=Streptomyces sp. P17 TaxID=3074716 RepID=UPI0028F4025A|nr:Vms1/Ankzf1 family peptidyl-tRNA hydrolase [Streptomyces sp. P17]MDT9695419.1 Vms1/Ankzf1 family peptidyl-tRNA hydrolase [Streptomyces sp. P17]